MSRSSTCATTAPFRACPTTPWSRPRAIVDETGAHPLPQRELSPEMLGLVQHAKAYERLAVRAACSGSRDDVVRALVANPLVGQYPLAADLADALLGANRHHLPRFFPS